MRDSVVEAFQFAEEHKACYLPYRDMVLLHHTLDIYGLAPAFRAKGDPLPAEDSSMDASKCSSCLLVRAFLNVRQIRSPAMPVPVPCCIMLTLC